MESDREGAAGLLLCCRCRDSPQGCAQLLQQLAPHTLLLLTGCGCDGSADAAIVAAVSLGLG
jgi:hypothetical protein